MTQPTPCIDISGGVFRHIGELGDRRGVDVYVVGGYVRDALLGKKDADIDILVVGEGVSFAREVASVMRRPIVPFERFGTAMIPLEKGKLEFVGSRREEYEHGSRKPFVQSGTLHDDLLRRDFTVNTLAVKLNGAADGTVIDSLGGMADLEQKVLRTPLDPESTFRDDPLRMMRAVRFAAQLNFKIDDAARAAITKLVGHLSVVSQERITEELLKLLAAPSPSVGLLLMYEMGLLNIVFPEIATMAGTDQRRDHHHKDVFRHTCIVVDNIAKTTDNLWLRFAALVHDIAKPKTKAYKEGIGWTFHGHEEIGARMMKPVFRRLKLPMDHLPYVEKLVRLHLRPMVLVDEEVTDSAVRRLVFDAGNDIDDLMKLCRADITSKNAKLVNRYLKNYDRVVEKIAEVEEKDRLRNWQPPVKGEEIMSVCSLQPGKQVGLLKKAIEEAILDGVIPNEHDAALAYLLSIKDDILAGVR